MARRNNEVMDALDLVLAAICVALVYVLGAAIVGAGIGICAGTVLRMLAWMGV